jgi:hypothetical protein
MPSNVAAAVPTGVLPQTLCTAFSENRVYPMLTQPYHDGTTERSLIVNGVDAAASIRRWRLSKRLKASDLATLKTFFESHNGGLTPFYFYVPFENVPGFPVGSNFDATGASTQGRHTVVFRGDWSETVGLARTDTPLELAEIA